MRLFSRLLHLHAGVIPLENFFTEIVAYVLGTSHEFLCDWLKYINLVKEPYIYTHSRIMTQQRFAPLEHYEIASYPDILIELFEGEKRTIILIESRLGSGEGADQLTRYAEILSVVVKW
ncbi:hypothetical protein U27_02055 [Candidatus Vecturithrix granuli]|uniref:Uncharacterized protein n=1 Tax=Vecturithrix granuli TaxID=1499967 RepID=A0A0S6W6I8_VECG1|nr:hypothetical protein U27_02055 [Candidatus Vecturithrix granuli]